MNSSDKRKHFRFPVYDDEAGVKLNRRTKKQETRDRLYSSSADNVVLDPVEMVAEPDFFGEDGLPEIEVERAKPSRAVQQQIIRKPVPKQVNRQPERRVEPKLEYKQDKRQVSLEDEDVSIKKMDDQVYAQPSKQEYKAPQSTFSNKLYEADQNGQAKYRKRYSGKKPFKSSYNLPGENSKDYFKPKYIPASLIEDEPPKFNEKESSELIEDLRKASQENMFLINEQQEQMSHSNEETKKEGQPKKHQRLEKSLSGIIEDESSQHLDNYYFD